LRKTKICLSIRSILQKSQNSLEYLQLCLTQLSYICPTIMSSICYLKSPRQYNRNSTNILRCGLPITCYLKNFTTFWNWFWLSCFRPSSEWYSLIKSTISSISIIIKYLALSLSTSCWLPGEICRPSLLTHFNTQ